MDGLESSFHQSTHITASNTEFTDSFNQAQILYAKNEYIEALRFYFIALRKCEAQDARLFEVFKNIGNILVKHGDLDGAEENYNKAFAINSNSDVLMVNFGTLELQKQNLEPAKERFRKAVELNAQNPNAWTGLALVHREFGDHELAWANIESALDLNSTHEAAIEMAIAWGVKDSKFSQLIDRLECYLKINPSEAMSLQLAKVLICSGRIERSVATLKEILQKNQNSTEAQNLARMLNQTNEVRA